MCFVVSGEKKIVEEQAKADVPMHFRDTIMLHHIICHHHCLQMEIAGCSIPLTSSNSVFLRRLLKV